MSDRFNNGQFSEWRRLILDKLRTNTESIKDLENNQHTFEIRTIKDIKDLEADIKVAKKSAIIWSSIGASITTGVIGLIYLILTLVKN